MRLNIANLDRSESPVSPDYLDVIMKKSQSRMWKTQNGELQFVISIAETQNVLGKFAGCYFECGSCSIDKATYDTPFRQTHKIDSIL